MLAIVIPYYKRTFFEATLQSLSDQTDQRFKVYIGDDASPEDPSEILEKFAGSIHFEYKKFDRNMGSVSLVKQWERCIAMIKDEQWLHILGDDDTISENFVASFYAFAEKYKEATVFRFATYKINGLGEKTSSLYQHPETEKATDFIFRKTRSSLSEYMFRLDRVKMTGFKDFPLAWYSDVLAVLEFSDFSNIYTINNATALIRISELSISGNQDFSKDKKTKASFLFYCYLLTSKRHHFTREQQNALSGFLEKIYLYNKKEFRFFAEISKLYIGKLLFRRYFSFLKDIVFLFSKSKSHANRP